jgi:uncharacterized protein YbjT (DUF2867 family)
MSGKSIVVVGATGMVGGIALRLCLEDPDTSAITVIGRSPVGVTHGKLREVIHEDFMDYSTVANKLTGHDAALFCLGVYTGTVPDEEFRRITIDWTVAFASLLRERSPQAAFCFLSGQGADQTEKSRMSFARYKGAAEKALIELGFPRLHIFRPGYIYPVTPRKEPNLTYRISRALYPLLRRIYPNIGISSEDLALAMVHAGLHGTGMHDDPILENRDIRVLAERALSTSAVVSE